MSVCGSCTGARPPALSTSVHNFCRWAWHPALSIAAQKQVYHSLCLGARPPTPALAGRCPARPPRRDVGDRGAARCHTLSFGRGMGQGDGACAASLTPASHIPCGVGPGAGRCARPRRGAWGAGSPPTQPSGQPIHHPNAMGEHRIPETGAWGAGSPPTQPSGQPIHHPNAMGERRTPETGARCPALSIAAQKQVYHSLCLGARPPTPPLAGRCPARPPRREVGDRGAARCHALSFGRGMGQRGGAYAVQRIPSLWQKKEARAPSLASARHLPCGVGPGAGRRARRGAWGAGSPPTQPSGQPIHHPNAMGERRTPERRAWGAGSSPPANPEPAHISREATCP